MANKKKKSGLPILLIIILIAAAVALYFIISSGALNDLTAPKPTSIPAASEQAADVQEVDEGGIPQYSGTPYYVLNDNQPEFTKDEITTEAYEYFEELDELGRCGVTMACVGQELMPTEDRESISHVKPSGWINVPYDFVDGRYLYNRSHLIGFQLTGENDNELNLITGTRYFNVEGMLPFENMVADYVKETDNHVMYRVTPIFEGDELVARGVQMEAWSVEDEGEGLCYNVYVYNVQPGVAINYATGESKEDDGTLFPTEDEEEGGSTSSEKGDYVLNTSSKKFHRPECSGAKNMDEDNRQEFSGKRDLLTAQGYKPCGQCDP